MLDQQTRGVPVSMFTAITNAINEGIGGDGVYTQQHLNALLKAVGDILAYNEAKQND